MCTALQGEVYLHSRWFPKPVMAYLKSLDIRKGMFILSGFTYTDVEWVKRQHERVQPKNPNYATLRWRKKEISACIENISSMGSGFCKLYLTGGKNSPAHIHLDFSFSGPQHHCKGKIIYINNRQIL
jgi:hypothetical protein